MKSKRANRAAGFLKNFLLAATVGAWPIISSCATNPVTGRREFSLISESQEIDMGKQYSAEVIQSIGLVNDPALQSYVKNIGLGMARASERPNLPWEFHVVDDAAVNAFAIPGGFVFVTRGLMAHLSNEAELASVLGHENGHVTAKHSVAQMSNQTLAQLGLVVGMVVSPTIAKFGDLASAGLGVLFLKFGRDDELQADDLGFRYSLAAGYDVREMAHVFEMLQAQAALHGGGRLPEWQSTHPDPGNRIKGVRDKIPSVEAQLAGKKVGRNEFLNRVNGLVFGENPRQGFFEGRTFYHPDLQFRLDFPNGWTTQNQPAAVVGVSDGQDALAELRLVQGSASAAAQQFFATQGVQAGGVTSGSVHGFPAVAGEFAATVEGGTLRGIGTFIEYGGRTYRILTYSPADRYSSYANVFRGVHGSFDRVTDSRVLNVQPMKVRVERVSQNMTLTQFNQQMPSVISIQELAVMNGMQANTQLTAGQMIKRVVR